MNCFGNHPRRTQPASAFNDEADSEMKDVNVVNVYISNSREFAPKQRHECGVKVHNLFRSSRVDRGRGVLRDLRDAIDPPCHRRTRSRDGPGGVSTLWPLDGNLHRQVLDSRRLHVAYVDIEM
ncbi:hypothetical protein RISK_001636 [Rhodopirellula islandica]|uniref:Uncharacterized protein n=1 Tax=Rhodopirellula islandica TaxID=595434 RepID=A0A0J1BIR3_RHOIS|nr:hypothetical protein RISK_001636 [Rhodopirellula islandica]